MFLLSIILPIVLILTTAFIYWRFFHFFRDPERVPPSGNNIVAPADGTIVYIRRVEQGKVPIAIKENKEIKLEEITKVNRGDMFNGGYIIGTFMSPLDVHVNRSPISGKIEQISYFHSRNLSIRGMMFSVLRKRPPLPSHYRHVLQNERNTIFIGGELPICVVQIADSYVNKIECRVKEGQDVKKGERIGRIIMGSQVDLVFPSLNHIEIRVKEGQRARAGETILATYHPETEKSKKGY